MKIESEVAQSCPTPSDYPGVITLASQGFPCSSVSKESACSAGALVSIPGLGISPGEGNGNPLQCPFLENLMDRGESHGQRSLVGCNPWRHKESGTTERLTLTYSGIQDPGLRVTDSKRQRRFYTSFNWRFGLGRSCVRRRHIPSGPHTLLPSIPNLIRQILPLLP